MKSLFLACSFLALSCPAFADTSFDWTGPYIGVQGAMNNTMLTVDESSFLGPTSASGSDVAFSGGADMGYNFQSGQFVYGAEVDANFITGSTVDVAAKDTYRAQPGWYGTARARVGFSSNDVLLYGTGGLAFGDAGIKDLTTGFKVGPALQLGWVVGAGMEVAVSQQLSVKAELLHLDLGKQDHLNFIGANSDVGYQDNIARVGINFRF